MQIRKYDQITEYLLAHKGRPISYENLGSIADISIPEIEFMYDQMQKARPFTILKHVKNDMNFLIAPTYSGDAESVMAHGGWGVEFDKYNEKNTKQRAEEENRKQLEATNWRESIRYNRRSFRISIAAIIISILALLAQIFWK